VTPPIDLGLVRRVVLRCPNWLGDTVMAVPTLRGLRDRLPGAELWCVGPWVGTILEAEPGIARRLAAPREWRGRLDLVRTLRAATPDLVVLLPNSLESALVGWLSGARWRVGHAVGGRGPLLTHRVPPTAAPTHQVAVYLALLAPIGLGTPVVAPRLAVAPARRSEARRLLGEVGVTHRDRPVAIQLGAGFGPAKLWPTERVADLARRLEGEGVRVVFLGDRPATPILRGVEARLGRPARHLVGRDHPALLPALLAEVGVLVGPDSGPAHVAAAVGVPAVTLFGPTDPRLTAPLGDEHVALWRKPACAPCFRRACPIDHRCLTALTVDEVATAVLTRRAARLGGGGAPVPA
jgi:heptosyltransferase-2